VAERLEIRILDRPEPVLWQDLDGLAQVRQRLRQVADRGVGHAQQVLNVVVAGILGLEFAELSQGVVERAPIQGDRDGVEAFLERPRLRLAVRLPLADRQVDPGTLLQLLLVDEIVEDGGQEGCGFSELALLERLEPALERLDGVIVR
jgi:hypothetical protein